MKSFHSDSATTSAHRQASIAASPSPESRRRDLDDWAGCAQSHQPQTPCTASGVTPNPAAIGPSARVRRPDAQKWVAWCMIRVNTKPRAIIAIEYQVGTQKVMYIPWHYDCNSDRSDADGRGGKSGAASTCRHQQTTYCSPRKNQRN